MLAVAGEGRVDLVAAVAPGRSIAASRPARSSARRPRPVGGGGGGRDTIARAGGRDPAGLPEALRLARETIEAALALLANVGRVLALDYGSARCGCAVSDPTGVLATPLEPVCAPAASEACDGCASSSASSAPSGWSSGCRSRCPAPTRRRRRRHGSLRQRLSERAICAGRALRRAVHDEARRATRRAGPSEDSRAAAHLLEGWLAAHPEATG